MERLEMMIRDVTASRGRFSARHGGLRRWLSCTVVQFLGRPLLLPAQVWRRTMTLLPFVLMAGSGSADH